MRWFWCSWVVCVGLAAGGCAHSRAMNSVALPLAESPVFAAKVVQADSDGSTTTDEPSPGEWSITAMPYLWAAEIDGRVSIKGQEASGTIKFKDVLENLELGLIGHVEAKRGTWTILVDVVYLHVGDDLSRPAGADVNAETLLLETGVAFELTNIPLPERVTLEALGGTRYVHTETDLDVTSVCLLAAAGLVDAQDVDGARGRPNIVLIVADDMGIGVGSTRSSALGEGDPEVLRGDGR